MFQLIEKEMNQLRILIAIPLLAGIIWSFSSTNNISLNEAVPAGKATITVESLKSPNKGEISVMENGSITPNHVFINTSTLDQLVACPGIGKGIAKRILLERSYGKFADWRDLDDRIKGISKQKIELLKEAGVRLDAP